MVIVVFLLRVGLHPCVTLLYSSAASGVCKCQVYVKSFLCLCVLALFRGGPSCVCVCLARYMFCFFVFRNGGCFYFVVF